MKKQEKIENHETSITKETNQLSLLKNRIQNRESDKITSKLLNH
jgi:uncharacterized coiled-coil protein SlyX